MKDLCVCGRPAVSALKKKRLKAGALLKDVAERAGISDTYLKLIEAGKRPCAGPLRDRVLAAIEGKRYSAPPKPLDFDNTPMGAGL